MNKYLLIAFFLSLTIELNASEPVASLVLSNTPVSNNLTHFTNTNSTSEAYTIQTTQGGSQCRQIPVGKYAYFKADDAAIPSNQNNLIFNITFYDEGYDKITLQYNANDGNSYKSTSFSKTSTNTWITARIVVINASFNNLQNNACDFRISGNGVNYIKEISIEIGVMDPSLEQLTGVTASSYSELTGKSVAGYQAWFRTGDATSGWVHWSSNIPPAALKTHMEIYPDVTDYEQSELAQTALADLGNGTPSLLFNSSDKSVIDKHFEWMNTYGIDGVAVQRFIGNIGGAIIISPNSNPIKIKQAAEATGRIFYICYDISSAGFVGTWDDVIKFDWVYNVEQNNNLTSSPAYAKVGNKPVVQLWGPGFCDNDATAAEAIALINFLKSRGCYVIGGTPAYWRDNNRDARGPSQPLLSNQESYENVYKEYDMISPWMAGRFKNSIGADAFLSRLQDDKSYCDARNIKFMPCIFPGFGWSQWNEGPPNSAPRMGGEFMWTQAKNIRSLGVTSMYFGMFDEYDEGTAIMKNATDWSTIPTDQYFLTSSADGIWFSSDFQLRVAGAAAEMIKGTRIVTTNVPVPYSNGPVYYRNGFESRTTPYNYVNNVAQNTGTFPVDPCFYKPGVILNSNVSSPVCEIQQTNFRSGLYSVSTSGTIASSSSAKYYYKIGDTKIAVKPNMKISFWKKTINDLGRYVFVDLITKSNKNLRDNGYADQYGTSMHPGTAHGSTGAGWEKFTCKFGTGILIGDTITGIVIAYDHTGSGSYSAYFDDFQIDDSEDITSVMSPESSDKVIFVYPNPSTGKFLINLEANNESVVTVYDISGKMVFNEKVFNNIFDISNQADGIYIMRIIADNKEYFKKLIKTKN